MVVFAITREGYLELAPVIKTLNYPLWVGAGVLSSQEIVELRELGLDMTEFSYVIGPNDMDAILGALDTISTHHPGHRIWIKCLPD